MSSRLPSFLRRDQQKRKKAQKVVHYNRDVICLPSSYGEGGDKSITIPRGKQRAMLAKMGLQGKVTLTSVMSEDDIRSEIRSAFFEPMENDSSFPFTFFQTSGCGGKMLVAPSLSTSFNWNAQEVSKLGKMCFYILAGRRLSVEDVKVSMECLVYQGDI